MQDHGNSLETNYPYTAKDGTCNADVAVEPLTMPTAYVQLSQSDDALKGALALGPVAVGVDAATLTWQLYFGGVTQGWGCGTSIDHAVTAVGYGTASVLG